MEQVWKDAMSQLAKTAPGLFTILGMGQLTSAENHVFRWAPKSKDNAFGGDLLAKPENQSRIEEVLSQIAGTPCRFTVDNGSGKASQPSMDPASLDDVYKTFGAENVTIQDE